MSKLIIIMGALVAQTWWSVGGLGRKEHCREQFSAQLFLDSARRLEGWLIANDQCGL